jgi:phage regulator Rha-like protein
MSSNKIVSNLDGGFGELSVIAQGEELVVDSRLIADRLGLQHESLQRTIKKYSVRLQALGNLRFEIGTSTNSIGATHQPSGDYRRG